MKKYLLSLLLILTCWLSFGQIKYPQVRKENVVDDYFGTKVADPYRWLENDTAAEVRQWVKEQNKITFDYLEKVPFRRKIKERLTELNNFPKYSSPSRKGDYYFFAKNDGLQNQSVIYYQKGLDGKPEVFLDPNKLSADGSTAVHLLGFSNDKKYLAYAVNERGGDWQKIYVMDIAKKERLKDSLVWIKWSGAAWKGNGFYYSRYDVPEQSGKEFSNKNQYHKVYYHRLGDSQDKDELIYQDKSQPLRNFYAQTTDDERFLIINITQGTYGHELWYKDLSSGQKDFAVLFMGFKNEYAVLDNDGDRLIVKTDDGAPNQRIISVDPKNSEKSAWKTIVPELAEPMHDASLSGKKIFATYLKDVTSRTYQYDYSGKKEREIILPGLGSVSGFGGNKDDKETFYTYTSFNYPPAIFKYDIASGKSEVWQKPNANFNSSDFEVNQVFYTSKDGTKIPMFIVHKKGLVKNGKNPTLLFAYGGFSNSKVPEYEPLRIWLAEQGGIYALANIRGGGEYGDQWHKAGMLEKRQNVFDDFIAAAEYLQKEKYTSKDYLAIEGRSNGGLLVGACMTQRPDLYKVCFPKVGVMDMLRYHKFTVGWAWAVEFGSSDSAHQFKYLYAYSPLHNIRDASYPATMVTTADHDDRVVPAHSFKFISTIQEHQKGPDPVLIRIDINAAHGAAGSGKPIGKIIDEQADMYTFMFKNMNLDVK
jgi:prolyl oligopeptidase